jgi:predicted metalloprotease with PDZ domain
MNREELDIASISQSDPATAAQRHPNLSHSSPANPQPASLQFHYHVAMPEPTNHLFEVTLQVRGLSRDCLQLDLRMPVWTPGSYLVREYARHLQGFAAYSGTSDLPEPNYLNWQKLSKNHWQIQTQGAESLTVRYQIYANELTVRTNHLDITHGYFNGAALFFYVPGYECCPIQVTIVPPYPTWQVATVLPLVSGQANTFQPKNFDTLVDSPFEIGTHQRYEFEAEGKPHSLVVWGEGNFDPDRAIADIRKVIQVEADLFGGLPYDRYLFLLHLTSQGFGGLEHKDSCSLIYQRFGFRNQDKYDRFIQLVAHEFFHLWNVKRIRPKALEVFDYEQENYTPSLWFSEGTTSYYDLVLPYRAGVYRIGTYLNTLSKEITRFLTTPGRSVQPLSESSFDAWIKLYRQDANSANSQMSYYLKGEMVSLLLDLLIRSRHQNRRSLDDVMRQMWQQFGKDEIGFTPEQLQQVIETIAGIDLTEFFDSYLHSTVELPFDQYLEPFGLYLHAEAGSEEGVPFLGMNAKTENGRDLIKFVEMGSPAQKAGLDSGDELLALNSIRVTADQLTDRLRDFQAGDIVTFTVFHQDELHTRSVVLAPTRATRYQVLPLEHHSPQQAENFQGWLGVPLVEIF